MEIIKELFDNFRFGFLFGVVITMIIYNQYQIPSSIEKRAKNLNLFHYDGKLDKFVPNDSIKLSKEEFYYLQYGSFK